MLKYNRPQDLIYSIKKNYLIWKQVIGREKNIIMNENY